VSDKGDEIESLQRVHEHYELTLHERNKAMAENKALSEQVEKLTAVAEAAESVLPLFQERVENTTQKEWGFCPYSATAAALDKALATWRQRD